MYTESVYMAIITRKELGEITNIHRGNIGVYIKRGKIVLTPDGKVDTEHEANKSFIEKHTENKKDKEQEKKSGSLKAAVAEKVIKEKTKKKITPQPEVLVPENEESASDSYHTLEKKIKAADLKKKTVDTRIALLKEAKMKGENIPIDLVMNVFSQLGNAMITGYRSGSENFLQEICHRNKISDKEFSRLKGELIRIINECHNNSIEAAKKSLKKIQNDYSDRKERGEHE